jgi:hypothetical protein
VKVYGSIYSAESCSYDAGRGLILVPNRGVPQNVQTNNAWVSLLNHDGSVHTARWIGVQNPAERSNLAHSCGSSKRRRLQFQSISRTKSILSGWGITCPSVTECYTNVFVAYPIELVVR